MAWYEGHMVREDVRAVPQAVQVVLDGDVDTLRKRQGQARLVVRGRQALLNRAVGAAHPSAKRARVRAGTCGVGE